VHSEGCVNMHYHRFREVPLSFVGSDAVNALAPPPVSNAQTASTSFALPQSSVTSMAYSREHAAFILQSMMDADHVSDVGVMSWSQGVVGDASTAASVIYMVLVTDPDIGFLHIFVTLLLF